MPRIKQAATAFLAIIIITSILTACGSNLISTDTIARQIGAHYGDPHARVSGVKSTTSDPAPGHPMYLMTIVGSFHKNGKTASSR